MLDVVDLTVAYGPMEAVHGVSFQVEEGAIVTLIGPNGAGKTTILNTISGVVPARSGQILFHGQDITRMSAHRRVSVGVIQVPEGRQVLAGMTVRENLELGGYRRPLSGGAEGRGPDGRALSDSGRDGVTWPRAPFPEENSRCWPSPGD